MKASCRARSAQETRRIEFSTKCGSQLAGCTGPSSSALAPQSVSSDTFGARNLSLAKFVQTMPSNVAPPNKRLKLAGGDRLKGNGALCPGGARIVVQHPCAGGLVARSLS